jgi:hypothetical protein
LAYRADADIALGKKVTRKNRNMVAKSGISTDAEPSHLGKLRK